MDQILEFSVDFMVNRIGMAVATLYLWDDEQARFTLRAYHGVDEKQREEINQRRIAGFDLAQKVIESGREIFIPNMLTEPGFHGIWEDLENRSYVKMPLISRGIIVGMFGLQTHGGQPMTVRDVQFLKTIGRALGIAIDNSLLISDAQKREEQSDTLFNIGTRISSSLSLRVVLDAIAEAARELINTDIGLIGLIDDRTNEVLYQAGFGLSKTLSKKMRLKINAHPDWALLLDHQPLIKNKADFCKNCFHDHDFIKDEDIKAGLTVPLFRAGSMIGLIEVFSRVPRKFSAVDSQLLNRLSTQVVVAIENAQLYHQLRHLAVLEERDLIARNLHDHLAQGLGYIKVKASIAQDLLETGEIEETSGCLKELIRTTQSMYTDVREEIFNLRQEVAEFDNFFVSMDEYLCEYKKYYDLDVDLIIERNCLCDLPPDVANQLLRVVQEA
ncbi:MAG: GAF domain-containing protein, partial [candidate division Zixibacteria bacterium]|nr:GAF domain-containing protein [candidate division Zixibacteria bacterium]